MSNFDNFDIHQISPKPAQRWHFVSDFYCKKVSKLVLMMLKMPKDSFLLDTRYQMRFTDMVSYSSLDSL